MEQESGFIIEPELDGQDAAPQLLHRSDAGFSEVWRVTKFSQFVVLKALKPEYRGNPVYETLLRKEFEIGYSLNHPSVCRTWHFRHHPQLGNCIEMEWIDGATLEERFRDARPDEGLFRKIAGELCDAVAYLHSRQVIHRDIKPSNILITHNGDNVKLIDFGRRADGYLGSGPGVVGLHRRPPWGFAKSDGPASGGPLSKYGRLQGSFVGPSCQDLAICSRCRRSPYWPGNLAAMAAEGSCGRTRHNEGVGS